jgi:hypothetical protein
MKRSADTLLDRAHEALIVAKKLRRELGDIRDTAELARLERELGAKEAQLQELLKLIDASDSSSAQ